LAAVAEVRFPLVTVLVCQVGTAVLAAVLLSHLLETILVALLFQDRETLGQRATQLLALEAVAGLVLLEQ
jgi:hypothetical protein